MYDSTDDTLDHIRRVQACIRETVENLMNRASVHDMSKLQDPEMSLLDRLGSQTNLPEYGSEAERARFNSLAEFRALHYAANDHHPEHYPNGMQGMSLMALIEMVCDWHAAGARHTGGDIWQSLEFNRKRFNISDELYSIIENTVKELGW